MIEGQSRRLLLLRHGNTFSENEICYQVGLKTDLPLTEKGLLQASRFSDYLKKSSQSPFAIYSGSLQRQTQTASIIHTAFPNSKLLTDEPAFNELDYGAWEGLTPEAIQAQWPSEYNAWQYEGKWPAEVFNQNLSIHINWLKQWLLNLHKTTPANALIVAVSSQGIIRLMLHFMPLLWESIVNDKKMGDFKVGTGCYCELLYSMPEQLAIQAWNQKP